jgi:hypothetical protein
MPVPVQERGVAEGGWRINCSGPEPQFGANIEEARPGQCRPDFIGKNAIVLKEARETNYWIRLLIAAELVPEARLSALRAESGELMKIIGAIVVSSRRTTSKR